MLSVISPLELERSKDNVSVEKGLTQSSWRNQRNPSCEIEISIKKNVPQSIIKTIKKH